MNNVWNKRLDQVDRATFSYNSVSRNSVALHCKLRFLVAHITKHTTKFYVVAKSRRASDYFAH